MISKLAQGNKETECVSFVCCVLTVEDRLFGALELHKHSLWRKLSEGIHVKNRTRCRRAMPYLDLIVLALLPSGERYKHLNRVHLHRMRQRPADMATTNWRPPSAPSESLHTAPSAASALSCPLTPPHARWIRHRPWDAEEDAGRARTPRGSAPAPAPLHHRPHNGMLRARPCGLRYHGHGHAKAAATGLRIQGNPLLRNRRPHARLTSRPNRSFSQSSSARERQQD